MFGSLDQQYWLGSYENHTFTPNAYYAKRRGTYLDATIWKTAAKAGWWDRTKPAGRRIMWGGFHSMMTLPRELGVGTEGELTLKFVDELRALRLGPAMSSPAATVGRHLEIRATFEIVQPRTSKPIPQGMVILSDPSAAAAAESTAAADDAAAANNATTITWNGTFVVVKGPCMTGTMKTCEGGVNGGLYTPLSLAPGELLDLHVFVDGGIIEVIANARRLITSFVLPPSNAYNHSAVVLGEGSTLRKWEAWTMRDLGPPHGPKGPP
jgi:hypothetical protein